MYGIGNQGKIMRKLLRKPTAADASPHDTPAAAAAKPNTSAPLAPHYRPAVSQDVVYPVGVPVACLDSSPDGRSAVLAGRHVLKTVTVDGLAVSDGVDLRALLAAQPAQRNNIPTSVADQLSIKAVKWGEPQGKQVLFTAGTSGKIFQYDLARAATTAPGAPVDCVQIREDSRQVNALDINPHRNSWLLSGSQDGIVRCFDVRQPTLNRTGATFRSIQAFKCNADGVHHVQWNPVDGFIFACATEQGSVLKWDMRKPSAPILRIKAHEKTCTAMAWHPDGVHLVSAGLDSKCHVWDLAKQDKRQKPKWTLSTPAPAGALAWRPGQWSATARGKRASQLAVAYDESSQKRYGISAVHIWDLARPTMPYKEIQRFDVSPSAMLWHDQYLLWTAGQDCIFSQCDVSFAPKVIDRQAVSTMAFSPRGEVLMLLDERPPQRPRPHLVAQQQQPHDAVPAVPSYSSSPTTPRLGVSQSDSEDDAIGTFIGPRRRGSRRRRPSTRSTVTLSTTPPAGPGIDDVMSLEQTIEATGTYKPQQAMAVSHVPAAANAAVYGYLAVNYLEALHQDLPYSPGGSPLPDRVAIILEHYAKAAANVKQFRLAQTWRILAYAVDMLLHRRAQYHLERRMDRHDYSTKGKSEAKAKAKAYALTGLFETPTKTAMSDGGENQTNNNMQPKVGSAVSLDKALRPRSLLSEELESSSNIPTPVARPVSDDAPVTPERGRKLTPIAEPEEGFTLPPAAHPSPLVRRKRLDSVPLSVASHDSGATHASTEGYDFYDTETMLDRATDPPNPRPTSAPREPPGSGSPSRPRRPVLRQDSEDSYVHLFYISDESRRATGLTTASEDSVPGQPDRAAIVAKLQNGNEGEFESRIRGKELGKSPPRNPVLPLRNMLARTETDMTTFTDEHHAITQTTTDSLESRFPSQTEAGGSLADSALPLLLPPAPESPASPDDDQSPFIVETDYLCWFDDAPYPYPIDPASGFSIVSSTPLQPYTLISRALAFETKSSALNASAIILLLKPLIPDDVIDSFQAAAILRQHHARLLSMKLFTEAALLRKLCIKGWPGGALTAWGDNYPAIFTPAQEGVQASFVCTVCHKPREVDRTAGSTDSIWRCERCAAVMAGCAVCGGRDVAPVIDPLPWPPVPPRRAARDRDRADPKANNPDSTEQQQPLSTWWYCPGCSHGGHASCLATWHAALESGEHPALADAPGGYAEPSEGCCPLDGCGHACLPARRGADMAVVGFRGEAGREATRALAKAAAAAAAAAAGRAAEVGFEAAHFAAEEGHAHGHGHAHAPPQMHPADGGIGWRHGGGFSGVRSDGFDVPQSRAVETVRETLGTGTTGTGIGMFGNGGGGRAGMATATIGILSSSPGRGAGGAERERRKSVKFVAQEDRRY
ncbi:hypothetical protein C8A05DRAFT_38987 [Staphylotrichum tortipilum]|uniref:Uncharacterized protein n=1 Tax=Staphylotrichum tortipilum TaxID=2831512 RepID=A0AAN6MCC5_9PEZI|nr:hypothetical protein C8A05DRAFT_38987 [Staphylotrichum longicolle]